MESFSWLWRFTQEFTSLRESKFRIRVQLWYMLLNRALRVYQCYSLGTSMLQPSRVGVEPEKVLVVKGRDFVLLKTNVTGLRRSKGSFKALTYLSGEG